MQLVDSTNHNSNTITSPQGAIGAHYLTLRNGYRSFQRCQYPDLELLPTKARQQPCLITRCSSSNCSSSRHNSSLTTCRALLRDTSHHVPLLLLNVYLRLLSVVVRPVRWTDGFNLWLLFRQHESILTHNSVNWTRILLTLRVLSNSRTMQKGMNQSCGKQLAAQQRVLNTTHIVL